MVVGRTQRKCENYSAYVQEQDKKIDNLSEEVSLLRQLQNQDGDLSKNVDMPQNVNEIRQVNESLRRQLSDLKDYLSITRNEGLPLFL